MIDNSDNSEKWISNLIIENNQFRQRYLNRLGFQQENQETQKLENHQPQNLDFQLEYHIKSNEEIRNDYIEKLKKNNILKQHQEQKHQCIIILDWDDTLLCTSQLGAVGFLEINKQLREQLKELDISSTQLIETLKKHGKIFIITNAVEGWVEHSSRLYLPNLNKTIKSQEVQIISARSEFEKIYPGDAYRWKQEAFLQLKKNFDSNIISNIICLGDSNIEIEAAHILAKQFDQFLIKTIKFKEHPKPDELVKQHQLVTNKFDTIYFSLRNLTITLEKKQQIKSNNSQNQSLQPPKQQ